MSTIAEKLEYLDGTREKILTETNRLGVGLTEQDKFRDYAKGLHDGYVDLLNNGIDTLYDNMEKVSGSGSEITLENTEEAPMKSYINGDTYQFSTTGKNLAEFETTQDTTKYTYSSFEENNIQVNKTVTGGSFYASFKLHIPSAGRYKIKGNNISNQQFYIYTDSLWGTLKENFGISTTGDFSRPTTFDSAGDYVIGLYGSAISSYGVSNFMCVSSDASDGYEPYTNGASPNPDYPQPINVVSGRQEISVVGKNLFDKDNANILQVNLNNSTTISGNSTSNRTLYIPIQPNTTYTISKIISNYFVIGTTESLPQRNLAYYQRQTNASANSLTITTNSTAKYLICWFWNSNDTLTEQQILDSIQIEKGSTASEYEAYKEQSYEINLGKNLLDTIKTSVSTHGITFTPNSDGSIYVNGTSDGGLIVNILDTSNKPVLDAGTYTRSVKIVGTLNRNNANVSLTGRDTNNNNVLGYLGLAGEGTFYKTTTLNEQHTISAIQIYIGGAGAVFDCTIYPQLEKGNTPDYNYAPYKTPIELCKIGNYKDKIYKENGKWYIEKNIGKVVLDGSESWETQYSGDVHGWRTTIDNLKQTTQTSQSSYVISNYYESKSQDDNFRDTYGISNRANQNQIIIKNNDITNIDDFKTWLSTHNTIVYYVLATPTTTEITDTELISQLEEWYNQKSNKDTTYISVTSEDLPAILNVIAIKNYE